MATLEDTTTEVDTTPTPADADGDHDKFSHYVIANQQLDALVGQQPIVALCGKTWIPTEIDNTPEKRPVCPECEEIREGLE